MPTTDDPRGAPLLSVNHAGDSDWTEIACGNIGGAVHGVRAIPPERLRTSKLREVIDTLTYDALAEFSPGPRAGRAWTQCYPAW